MVRLLLPAANPFNKVILPVSRPVVAGLLALKIKVFVGTLFRVTRPKNLMSPLLAVKLPERVSS